MKKHKLIIYWSALALLIGNVDAMDSDVGELDLDADLRSAYEFLQPSKDMVDKFQRIGSNSGEITFSDVITLISPERWFSIVKKGDIEEVQKFIRGIDINVKKECNLYFKDPFQKRKKNLSQNYR